LFGRLFSKDVDKEKVREEAPKEERPKGKGRRG
jgi:hypothetical protein